MQLVSMITLRVHSLWDVAQQRLVQPEGIASSVSLRIMIQSGHHGATGSKASQFGQDLASAMGLLEALPNPLMLAFDLLTSFGLSGGCMVRLLVSSASL